MTGIKRLTPRQSRKVSIFKTKKLNRVIKWQEKK